mmetsp:Transcript_22519/g.38886  ORF Transcript_22519/g.38886 Transcript_22519/m.38886 type:complete len:207 (+) Transcript_22519:443-1063(+)
MLHDQATGILGQVSQGHGHILHNGHPYQLIRILEQLDERRKQLVDFASFRQNLDGFMQPRSEQVSCIAVLILGKTICQCAELGCVFAFEHQGDSRHVVRRIPSDDRSRAYGHGVVRSDGLFAKAVVAMKRGGIQQLAKRLGDHFKKHVGIILYQRGFIATGANSECRFVEQQGRKEFFEKRLTEILLFAFIGGDFGDDKERFRVQS